ncbi:MAG: hypothetical protein E6G97_02525 [Alphaproteobacteria bacterium]|nr:MAG: hypothetical protein E6G97_02525 [Alphaproteobacteria bacterium]
MHRIVIAAALLVSTSLASAQDPAPPLDAAPAEPPARSAPTLPTPRETFGAIGRLIDQSISTVGAGVRGASETLGATTNAAGEIAKGVGDAAGTVARLPKTNIVSGHELCAAAPNGAPDCSGATVALCQSKGFQRGTGLDITSAYKCPAQMWREGRAPNPQECRDESFVSRAICQ